MAETADLRPITHRRILKIAIPVVLSNATIPILGAVDTGVVGQLGEAAPIGAVGIGAIILGAVYWIFGFLRMGTTGLVSQALGAGDRAEAAALLSRALIVAGLGGCALILFQVPVFWAAFKLSLASETVEGLARNYMGIRIWSAPAAIAIFGLTGWLIAAERTGAVLAIQVGMNGLNILLDLLFVLGLDWGVQGVAIATFIAEWSGFLLALWLCRDGFRGDAWRNWSQIFDRLRIFHMVRVNTDILIRSLLLQVGFVSFLLIGSDFGDVTLAANQILLQFLYITSYAMDGFTFSAEALVGQAMGARARGRLRQSVLMTSAWSLATVVVLAALFALIGPWLIALMATSPEVRAEALIYLPWMVAAPLLGGPSWIFDGIFIGATRSRDMRNMMIVSFAIYCLAILLLVDPYANHGLWAAMMVFFVARGATVGLRYPALERAAE